jgi:hypothetical protein
MEVKTEPKQKMSFNEYFENVVGKVSKTKEEIQAKEEELKEFLLGIIEKYAVVPEDSEKRKNVKLETSTEKIKHETVTIQVPKVLMNFIRNIVPTIAKTPKQYLEESIILSVCADLDTQDFFKPNPMELVKRYHLEDLNNIIKDAIPSYYLRKSAEQSTELEVST